MCSIVSILFVEQGWKSGKDVSRS